MKKITICLNLIITLSITGAFSSASAGNNAGGRFYAWPDTGQEKCYDNVGELTPCPDNGDFFFGQDAQYQENLRSYTKLADNGNELDYSATEWTMVRDNVTGLIWEVKSVKDGYMDYGNPNDADNKYTWCDNNYDTNGGNAGVCDDPDYEDSETFITKLNNINYGGFSDWRMPTVKELSTILNLKISLTGDLPADGTLPPAINTDYFPNTLSDKYWSATSYAFLDRNYLAWYTCFAEKCVNENYRKEKHYCLRAVRSGAQPPENSRFSDNGDGTITDKKTNLMWQKCSMGLIYENGGCTGGISDANWTNWETALDKCETLELANHDDWRLPSRNELQSLVDYSATPAINLNLFPDIQLCHDRNQCNYWTSTTIELISIDTSGNPSVNYADAFYTNFDTGIICGLNKDNWFDYSLVRAVRSISYNMDFNGDGDIDGQDLVEVVNQGPIDEFTCQEFAQQFGKSS